jgi:Peptidase family M28
MPASAAKVPHVPANDSPLQRSSRLMTLSLFVMGLVAYAGVWLTWNPGWRHAETASAFEVDRALATVRNIAGSPHTVGTAENGVVRDYLLGRLKELSLEVEVQDGFAVSPIVGFGSAGRVHNVIGRMVGREHGKPVVLVAHYDSVPTGPGAADDTASIGAILEVLRVIRQHGVPPRDIVCVFTDGEESGLLGSTLFVQSHRWIADAGVVLNYEYRGNRGPMMLFETSPGATSLVQALIHVAPHTMASSAFAEAYRYLPNNTDGTVFLKAGVPLLNFAAIDGVTAYHSRLDSPDALSAETLREQGETMLKLTDQLLAQPVSVSDIGGIVYFTLPLAGMVSYGLSIAWALAVVVVLLFVVVTMRLVRRRGVRGRRFVLSIVLVPLVLAGVVCVIAAAHESVSYWAQGGFDGVQEPYAASYYRWALAVTLIGMVILVVSAIRRWVSSVEIGLAAIGWCVTLQLACVAFVPGASYLLMWPCLFALAGMYCARIGNGGTVSRPLFMLAGPLVAALVLAPFLHALLVGLTLSFAVPFTALAVMSLVFLIPSAGLITSPGRLAGALLLCALALVAIGGHVGRFDASQPRAESLNLLTDGDTGKSYWASADAHRGTWNGSLLATAEGPAVNASLTGFAAIPFWIAPARDSLGGSAPSIEVLRDTSGKGGRTLILRIGSTRAAPRMRVTIDGAKVVRSVVNSLEYHAPGDRWRLDVFGTKDEPLQVEFDVERGTPVTIRVADASYGLPEADVHKRPATSMPAPYVMTDTWQIIHRLTL